MIWQFSGALLPYCPNVFKRAAFTLAKILITLVIIGVVAALTIPTVVVNYQKKAYYTQFMKVYNSLSKALNSAIAEHGDPNAWTYNNQFLDTYIKPYLNYVKESKVGEFYPNNTNCYDLSGELFINTTTSDFDGFFQVSESPLLELADGSVVFAVYPIAVISGFKYYALGVDTNGKKDRIFLEETCSP